VWEVLMIHSILFFNAITPVHNGAGEGLGVIDRPIMRERTTNYLIIQGSSIKGVLKDEYRPKLNNKLDAIFGPDDGEKHSSAMAFGDANILCFPVRLLKGVFVWATSPLALNRFSRMLDIAGLSEKFPKLLELLSENKIHSKIKSVFINPDSEGLLLIKNASEKRIILEEFPLKIEILKAVKDFADELSKFVYKSPSGGFLKKELTDRLVVLPEYCFSYFLRYATEVMPNIKIEESTGTSKEGLRYSEYLPSETIMYSLIGYEKPRITDAEKIELADDKSVRKIFTKNLPKKNIQIGADETKGKGFMEITIVPEEDQL